MSPWTNKYTFPGHMCVPNKSKPIGNEDHSTCFYLSGIMCAVEYAEGKDYPPQKLKEKFADITKKDQLQHYD